MDTQLVIIIVVIIVLLFCTQLFVTSYEGAEDKPKAKKTIVDRMRERIQRATQRTSAREEKRAEVRTTTPQPAKAKPQVVATATATSTPPTSTPTPVAASTSSGARSSITPAVFSKYASLVVPTVVKRTDKYPSVTESRDRESSRDEKSGKAMTPTAAVVQLPTDLSASAQLSRSKPANGSAPLALVIANSDKKKPEPAKPLVVASVVSSNRKQKNSDVILQTKNPEYAEVEKKTYDKYLENKSNKSRSDDRRGKSCPQKECVDVYSIPELWWLTGEHAIEDPVALYLYNM